MTCIGSRSYGAALTTSDLRDLRARYRAAGVEFPSGNPRMGVRRDNTVVTVYSYGIPVLAVRMTMQPAYMRLWGGWSVSTMNHISKMIGFSWSKANWMSMPVGEWVESDVQATIWRG